MSDTQKVTNETGLPAQLVREMLRAAATGANEIPASRYVVIPESVAAWLTALLNRHPDAQVRAFFRNELDTPVEVGDDGEAVGELSHNPFIDLFIAGGGGECGDGHANDAQPSDPAKPSEATGHWNQDRTRFIVDTLVGPCAGQSLN